LSAINSERHLNGGLIGGIMFFRQIAVALLSTVLFAGIALAKDGPFPITNASGIWKAEGSKLTAEIALGNFYSGGRKVPVTVTLRDGNHVLAVGTKEQKLKSKELSLFMLDSSSGHNFQLVMRAVYDNVPVTNPVPFKLEVQVFDPFDLNNPVQGLIFGR
jgi:hypothetical protein